MVKLLAVLVLFLFLASGCQHGKDKPLIYVTYQGEITKGDSAINVMNVLGNPRYIKPDETGEVWYYYFGQDKNYKVHFINNEVSEIEGAKEKEQEGWF